jgi:hypothetical protein
LQSKNLFEEPTWMNALEEATITVLEKGREDGIAKKVANKKKTRRDDQLIDSQSCMTAETFSMILFLFNNHQELAHGAPHNVSTAF